MNLNEVLESLDDITALAEALLILVASSYHGAGELSSENFQRLVKIIIGKCAKAQEALAALAKCKVA